MIDLIILDLYGTMALTTSYDNTPRKGFLDFLEKHKDKKIALATDDPYRDSIDTILDYQGVTIDHIYTGKDLIKGRKDLKRICEDHNVAPNRSVFISDGDRDRRDARNAGVRFIHVPKYISKDEPFSFDIDISKLPMYRDLR